MSLKKWDMFETADKGAIGARLKLEIEKLNQLIDSYNSSKEEEKLANIFQQMQFIAAAHPKELEEYINKNYSTLYDAIQQETNFNLQQFKSIDINIIKQQVKQLKKLMPNDSKLDEYIKIYQPLKDQSLEALNRLSTSLQQLANAPHLKEIYSVLKYAYLDPGKADYISTALANLSIEERLDEKLQVLKAIHIKHLAHIYSIIDSLEKKLGIFLGKMVDIKLNLLEMH